MRVWVTALLLLFLSATFFGCAARETKDPSLVTLSYHNGKTPDDIAWPEGLRKVFERYWYSRFSGLWEDTWAMEAPYFREMTPEKKYENFIKAHTGSSLAGIEVWSIETESPNMVGVRCELSYQKNGESKRFFNKDRWLKVRGEWYHIIQDRILFPSAL